MRTIRRFIVLQLLGVACAVGLAAGSAPATAGQPTSKPLHIGIIGTGNIGGTLATHWVNAGHEVMISGLDLEALRPLAAKLGPKARVGSPREAAAYGEVVLISVPYAALPQIGRDYAKELAGKTVIDTGNPYPSRDGEMATRDRERGTGVASKEYLPGVKLVRAFNAISWVNLRNEASRPANRIGIPVAGDDKQALAVASQLVRDAGFEPVVVGDLSQARRFDVDTPVYVKLLTAAELRKALELPAP